MGPFPHDAPPAKISKENPAGTDGFEFVEFAHAEPQKLAELFTRMGYVAVAKHRTKDITVWRQGDINYVVNAEPGSHAMKFADKHGPCAASMAWRVVDAKHAFEHAVSKGATPQRPRLSMSLLVRTSTEPAGLTAAIRREILNIDKDQAVTEVATLEQVVGESIEQPRLTMFLLSIFGLVALTLAAIGIYGVMAYAVAQRTRELGIRMALGAQTLDVLKLVVRNGMTLAVIGVAIGLGGAWALTRLLVSLLFEVTATDATTFAIVSVGLLGVALLACFIPARRATKVDPLVALRYE